MVGLQTKSPRPPLLVAFATSVTLYALTRLTNTPWPGLREPGFGLEALTVGVCLPLIALSLPFRNYPERAGAILGCVFAGTALCFTAGLGEQLAFALDAGAVEAKSFLENTLAVLMTTAAIPLSLETALVRARKRPMMVTALVPAVAAGLSQLLWFGLHRLISGPTGLEYWIGVRVATSATAGLVAGFLTADIVPLSEPWRAFFRLPRFLSAGRFAVVATAACSTFAAVDVSLVLADEHRFIKQRLDDYYLALTNYQRAKSEQMVYPKLHDDLDMARNAILGSVDSGSPLRSELAQMLAAIEDKRRSESFTSFALDVMRVNRRLLDSGRNIFLEPHELRSGGLISRVVLRYDVVDHGRARGGGRSVLLLTLRRHDSLILDTPYLGLSYPGMGTVLLGHIEEIALRKYAPLLAGDVPRLDPREHRLAHVISGIRSDWRQSFSRNPALKRFFTHPASEELASIAARDSQVTDIAQAKNAMSAHARVVFDALTAALIAQTQIHEARHAMDGLWNMIPAALEELQPGSVAKAGAGEIRAHLTEVIDGPLGPRFGLGRIAQFVTEESNRATSYFFASIVILECLWGKSLRRPDITVPGSSGPKTARAPIDAKSPGRLSYSRITGAYEDLRMETEDELRRRAQSCFENLFDEPYPHIEIQAKYAR